MLVFYFDEWYHKIPKKVKKKSQKKLNIQMNLLKQSFFFVDKNQKKKTYSAVHRFSANFFQQICPRMQRFKGQKSYFVKKQSLNKGRQFLTLKVQFLTEINLLRNWSLFVYSSSFLPERAEDQFKTTSETDLDRSVLFLKNDSEHKKKRIPIEYSLDTFHRSNQDTCLLHKPAILEGDWVEKGDLLADGSASVGGELALGNNILIAYMPWEGFNYEDAILISERLVFDDVYTSIHIEKHETDIRETIYGKEIITKEIPEVDKEELVHLDKFGISKIGTWVEGGDILVGKVTPIKKKNQLGLNKLVKMISVNDYDSFKENCLRTPRGVKAKVVSIYPSLDEQITKDIKKSEYINSDFNKSRFPKNLTHMTQGPNGSRPKELFSSTKSSNFKNFLKIQNQNIFRKLYAKKMTRQNAKKKMRTFARSITKQIQKRSLNSMAPFNDYTDITTQNGQDVVLSGVSLNYSFQQKKKRNIYRWSLFQILTTKLKKTINLIAENSNSLKKTTDQQFEIPQNQTEKNLRGLRPSISQIQIFLAEKRKIQIGDKMSGRHGNKGIVSQILPRQDMPYLPDGTPVDMVLNPLGVPSRMNVGQLYECLLGLAGKYLETNFRVIPFDETFGAEASRSFVFSKLYEASQKTGNSWLFNPSFPGKTRLFDGRTGERFDQPVTVGYSYILKLVHLVDDKIHCLTSDHEVLTTNGWIPIYDLQTTHQIATLKKHGQLVYQKPTKIQKYLNYKGPVIRFQEKKIDLVVTEEHRMYVKNTRIKSNFFDGYEFIPALHLIPLQKENFEKQLTSTDKFRNHSSKVLLKFVHGSKPYLTLFFKKCSVKLRSLMKILKCLSTKFSFIKIDSKFRLSLPVISPQPNLKQGVTTSFLHCQFLSKKYLKKAKWWIYDEEFCSDFYLSTSLDRSLKWNILYNKKKKRRRLVDCSFPFSTYIDKFASAQANDSRPFHQFSKTHIQNIISRDHLNWSIDSQFLTYQPINPLILQTSFVQKSRKTTVQNEKKFFNILKKKVNIDICFFFFGIWFSCYSPRKLCHFFSLKRNLINQSFQSKRDKKRLEVTPESVIKFIMLDSSIETRGATLFRVLLSQTLKNLALKSLDSLVNKTIQCVTNGDQQIDYKSKMFNESKCFKTNNFFLASLAFQFKTNTNRKSSIQNSFTTLKSKGSNLFSMNKEFPSWIWKLTQKKAKKLLNTIFFGKKHCQSRKTTKIDKKGTSWLSWCEIYTKKSFLSSELSGYFQFTNVQPLSFFSTLDNNTYQHTLLFELLRNRENTTHSSFLKSPLRGLVENFLFHLITLKGHVTYKSLDSKAAQTKQRHSSTHDDLFRLSLHSGYCLQIGTKKSQNKKRKRCKHFEIPVCYPDSLESKKNTFCFNSKDLTTDIFRLMIQRFEAKIPKKLNYEGAIYCVTVPNEIFYVRRNGCSVWTGNSRSTGPYSIITQQPLRGRSKHGGQRLGEMEVWALEGYGAAFILLEMLTIKSDNINGRLTLWSKYLTNRKITIGIPESFYVLVSELRAICLNIGLFV
jgi:hypothetical protein